ncbi:MAG: PepSY domain-containing protein [Nitrospirota bacterium]
MKKKKVSERGGSASWEILFAILLVLIGAVAFAGQGHEKRVIIHGKHEDKRAIESLADDSEGDVEIDTGSKQVGVVQGQFEIDHSEPVDDAIVDFIDRHRDAFGLKNPKEELKRRGEKAEYGGHFQQMYNGVPIWGHSVGVFLDKNHNIRRINANIVPTPDIDTTPLITKEEAIKIATADRIAKIGGNIVEPLAGLWIYENKLAYEVGFLYRGHGWRYLVDAKTGSILYKADETSYDGAANATGTRYTGPPNASGNAGTQTVNFKLHSTGKQGDAS